MNMTATVAVLILSVFNGALGVLLLSGKVKLVPSHRQSAAPKPTAAPLVTEVVTPDFTIKKRGRPSKTDKQRKTRHLHLPPSITKKQLHEVGHFFEQHRDAGGDKIILHVPTIEGP